MFALVLVALSAAGAFAQSPGVTLEASYRVVPNVVYRKVAGVDCKLDVVTRRDSKSPSPTVIYIHGGGWAGGSKEEASLSLLPYLEKGFAAVNVEYRLSDVAPSPAAVEDVRCALRWVRQHAAAYGFDLSRVVVTGHSAGGHLSLMAAMAEPDAGFDASCPAGAPAPIAAVVNFFGVTDLSDVLEGPHRSDWALRWFAGQPREPLATRVSPITYARAGLPPVLTIHGDGDTIVPFGQAERLHERLKNAGADNRLVRVAGGGHGNFSPETLGGLYKTVFEFLGSYGIAEEASRETP